MTRRLELTADEVARLDEAMRRDALVFWLVRPGVRVSCLYMSCTSDAVVVGPLQAELDDPHGGTYVTAACAAHEDGLAFKRPAAPRPPAELVVAAAYCEDCGLSGWAEDESHDVPYRCPECLIELVGPCPTCGGSVSDLCDAFCMACAPTGTVTLGYAYAASDVLPYGDPRMDGAHPTPLVGQYALQLEVVR